MKTILIVTEGHQNDDIFQDAIQQRDHRFIIVRSLDTAWDSLQACSKIDIAIIQEDFDMPDSGWIVARALRQRFGAEVRIVMLIHGRNEDYFLIKRFDGFFDWVLSSSRSAMTAHLLHEFDTPNTTT